MQAGHLLFAFLLLASIPTRGNVGWHGGGRGRWRYRHRSRRDHQQHKIRIGGVDSPEKAQPYGQRSKQNMSALVFGKEVDVHWEKRDRYRRIVGKVMVQPSDCPTCPKTLDAGLAQITMGLAWWYEKYAKDQSAEDAGRYEFAEHEARAKRAGLWADASPIPPWDWRKAQRR